jgi:hypothetical protein
VAAATGDNVDSSLAELIALAARNKRLIIEPSTGDVSSAGTAANGGAPPQTRPVPLPSAHQLHTLIMMTMLRMMMMTDMVVVVVIRR